MAARAWRAAIKTRTLVWALWAATVSLVASALVLGLANPQGAPLYEVPSAIIAPTFVTLGALIVARRPGNVIGWIFLASGVLGGVQLFSGQYATVALVQGSPTLPGAALAAWWAILTQSSFAVSVLFLVLLFPDGKLPSRRWRPLAWAIAMFIAVSLGFVALSPGPVAEFPTASNPFGVEGATLPGSVLAAGELALAACVIAAIVSLIVRFYRSRGEERLQLKWFTYATMVGFPTPLILSELAPAVFQVLGQLLWTLGFLSLPVSAGVAILKYRLYDIDRVINRTLVYGSLTALLVLAYFGGVTTTQAIIRTFTGREELPQLAIVASTLLIAAMFNPLRRTIQAWIDRRFYRRKYDARKTLQEFTARLRDGTDLDELSDDLVAVARETVQPEHVSLWLRTPEVRR